MYVFCFGEKLVLSWRTDSKFWHWAFPT